MVYFRRNPDDFHQKTTVHVEDLFPKRESNSSEPPSKIRGRRLLLLSLFQSVLAMIQFSVEDSISEGQSWLVPEEQ